LDRDRLMFAAGQAALHRPSRLSGALWLVWAVATIGALSYGALGYREHRRAQQIALRLAPPAVPMPLIIPPAPAPAAPQAPAAAAPVLEPWEQEGIAAVEAEARRAAALRETAWKQRAFRTDGRSAGQMTYFELRDLVLAWGVDAMPQGRAAGGEPTQSPAKSYPELLKVTLENL
jgi:hypothetical protein